MDQISYPVTFMRGGTSKGLFFRAEDLPSDRSAREGFLLRAIGSPDPNGRQLDGMGGGVSSLSKVMLVSRSRREGVDVDYEFGQVAIDRAMIDGNANCGNLSAAVGVFAVEAGLTRVPDGEAVVRMFNVNTRKRVDCVLRVDGGKPKATGDLAIAGVAGTGSPIRLDFLEPGGAGTGRLLPTGSVIDLLELPDGSTVETSIVDAANPCVFVRAADLGFSGTELPTELKTRIDLMARLEAVRAAAAVAAGMAHDARGATRDSPGIPKVAMVAPAMDAPTLSGETLSALDCDIQVRMISMGLPHLAIPLTGAMCVGVAARIEGTLAHSCARPASEGAPFRVGHGSGAVPVSARVSRRGDGWFTESVSVFRTARVLMEGRVFVPAEELHAAE
jgi:hypothetical protein